jgi:hypothetical protein
MKTLDGSRQFIEENGGGPGVRLREAKRKASPGLDKGGRR